VLVGLLAVLPKVPKVEGLLVLVLPPPNIPPDVPVVDVPKAGLGVLPPKSVDPDPPPKGLEVEGLVVLDAPKPPKALLVVAVVEPPNKPPPAEEVPPKVAGLAPNAPVLLVFPKAPKLICQCAAK
jgi:hypothetical protein